MIQPLRAEHSEVPKPVTHVDPGTLGGAPPKFAAIQIAHQYLVCGCRVLEPSAAAANGHPGGAEEQEETRKPVARNGNTAEPWGDKERAMVNIGLIASSVLLDSPLAHACTHIYTCT